MSRSTGEVDVWYRRARERGYRARSSFKLLQVDERTGVLEGARRVVDLCAAPGSWSQVLRERVGPGGVVAVDLQEMAPIEGVEVIRGDITSRETAEKIVGLFRGERADVVVSDGAPDVTGLHEMDEMLQAELLLAALRVAAHVLRPGGHFVAKIFKGAQYPLLEAQLGLLFGRVDCIKPEASRPTSAEHFVVARGYAPPPDYAPRLGGAGGGGATAPDSSHTARVVEPFMECGSLAGYREPQAAAAGPGAYSTIAGVDLDRLAEELPP